MKKRVIFFLTLIFILIQGTVYASDEQSISVSDSFNVSENIGINESIESESTEVLEEKTEEKQEENTEDEFTEIEDEIIIKSDETVENNILDIISDELDEKDEILGEPLNEELVKTEPEFVADEKINEILENISTELEKKDDIIEKSNKEILEEADNRTEIEKTEKVFSEEENNETESKFLSMSAFQLLGNPKEKTLFEKLVEAIEEAESEKETEISLIGGDYLFEHTIKIDDNKKITLKNKDDNAVNFKRAETFKGTFIEIAEGSSLTLNGNSNESLIFDGEKRSNKGSMIRNRGSLVIYKATLKDELNSSSAPIYSSGKKSKIILNGGLITDNIIKTIYGSGGIYLDNHAEMVFNDGIISNNLNYDYVKFGKKHSASPGAGAIHVTGGSKLIMNGGEIDGNSSFAGGILIGEAAPDLYKLSEEKFEDLTDLDISYGVFNGGIISNNQGLTGGPGGIFISGSADVEFTENSTIQVLYNKSSMGGGIEIYDHYVNGYYTTKDEVYRETDNGEFEHVKVPKIDNYGRLVYDSDGNLVYTDEIFTITRKNGKVPHELWMKKYPAKFVMNGGIIAYNHSTSVGGGISVSSSNVYLNKGKIFGNHADDQGGGVYVTSVPYTLHLKNVIVTENIANGNTNTPNVVVENNYINGNTIRPEWELYDLTRGSGGGVWFCPTGNAEFYVDEGGAIFGNTAARVGDDFHSEKKVPGEFSITLPSRFLGGFKILYYEDELGNRYSPNSDDLVKRIKFYKEPLSLKAIIDSKYDEISETKAELFIYNNEANKGGGIGSNGNVQIGNPPSEDKPLKEITIKKEWEGVPDKEVEFEIGSKINGKELPFEKIILNKDNNYTVKLTDLPATIAGQDLEDVLYIKELTKGDYIFEPSEIEHIKDRTEVYTSEDESYSITFNISEYLFTGINKNPEKYGDIIISKVVIGEEDSEREFDFTIVLRDENEKELDKIFDYIISKADEIILTGGIQSGDTFQLSNGQSIRIKEVPYGTGYVITEEELENYEIAAEGEIGIVNSVEMFVEFTNTIIPEEPEEPETPPEIPEPEEPKTPPEIPEPEESENPPEEPDEPPEEPENPPEEPEEPEEPESPPEEPYNPKVAPKTFDPGIGIYLLIGLFSIVGFILLKKEYN